jgi:hypothetical protein
MTGFLYDLVHFFDSSQLAPHGVCLLWEPDLIWLHVLSDGTIGLAYFSIPIVLAAIIAKRPDLDAAGGGTVFHVDLRRFEETEPLVAGSDHLAKDLAG